MPSLPGFIGPTYQGRNVTIDGERCINLIPRKMEGSTGASKGSAFNYFGRPGLSLFATLSGGNIRAMWGGDNSFWAVCGGTLQELSSTGTVLQNLSIANASGPAQIISNGNQLLVWDGNLTGMNTWLAPGNQPPFTVISSVGITYMDGYFVALRPGGADFDGDPLPVNTLNQVQFNLSPILNGYGWDPLQFAIRNAAPDALQMLLAPGTPGGGPEELWLFGKNTIEVWYNTGGNPQNPFPLQRVPGAFINQGLWAKFSAVSLDNSIFFLGGDARGVGMVWRMNGYIPQRVSTHAIEFLLQKYTTAGVDTSAAISFAMQWEGSQFYVMTFPGYSVPALVYDVTENLWHEWASGSSYGALTSFGASYHCTAFSEHFMGDPASGKIYKFDPTVFQDNGSAIYWGRTAPVVDSERKQFFFRSLTLDVAKDATNLRTYKLEISDDAGQTFPNSITTTMGPGGENPALVQWRQLGSARAGGQARTFRVSSTDNFQQTWIDAYADGEPGDGVS